MPVIRIGSKSTAAPKSKPAAKTASTKRATSAKKASTTKRTTTKSGTTKPTAKRATTKATPRNNGEVKRRTPKIDPKLLTQHEKALKAAGKRRAEAEEIHNEAVNAVHEAANEALAAGVSMAIVSEVLGISRQWLYKMGSFRGRTNGNGAAKKKPAAKKTTAKTGSQAKAGRARQASAKGSSSRPRIRAKA